MGTVFLLCVGAQSVAGWAAYNSEQLGQREDPVDWIDSNAAPGVQIPVGAEPAATATSG